MKAIQRSITRYVVYDRSMEVSQIICHVGEQKWYVHPVRGAYVPQPGYDSPSAAAAAFGLQVDTWTSREEVEEPKRTSRARTIIGSVFGLSRDRSGS